MNYDKHVWIAESFFNETEVKEILAVASKLEWHGGRVGGNSFDPDGEELQGGAEVSDIRMSQVKWMEEHHLPQKFHEKLATAIQYASVENHWLWEFSHFENFQFTNYTNRPHLGGGDFYTWHTDSGPVGNIHCEKTGMVRKLSITIQLSDPDDYEGGRFEWLEPGGSFDNLRSIDNTIYLDNIKQSAPFSAKTKGSIIVFPSDVHHQVTPVTRGTRESLVGWLLGYPFK
jgi:PKHD-type hydroxylase|tara:strand:- start:2007 stop:2693 length:687 start_codon:yes stop_codon:yes gene_type:complete